MKKREELIIKRRLLCTKLSLGTIEIGFRASVLPPEDLREDHFDDFCKSHRIESRLMHSMRDDLTKTAQAAMYPEMLRNRLF